MDEGEELELTVLSLPLMAETDRWLWMLKGEDGLLEGLAEIALQLGPVSEERRARAYEKWLLADRMASIVSEGRATRVATEAELLEQQTQNPERRLLAQIARLEQNARIRLWRTFEPNLASCLSFAWSSLEVEPEGEDLDEWIMRDPQAAATHLIEKLWAPVSVLEQLTGLSPLAITPLSRRSPLQLLEAFAELHPEASRELRLRLPTPWLQKLLEIWDGQPPSGAAEDWMELANLPDVTFWQWGEAAPIDQALSLLQMCGLSAEAVRECDPLEIAELEMESFGLYPLFLLSELPAEDYLNHLEPLLSEEARRLCPQWAVDGLRQRNMFHFLDDAPGPPWQEWLRTDLAPIVAHIERVAQQRFPSPAVPTLTTAEDFDRLRHVTITTFRHLARATGKQPD
jgi:hypothetical protein